MQTETVTKQINQGKLAQFVFEILASRERSAARSDIDAIFRELEAKHKREFDYDEYLKVWQTMESAGAGRIIYGRRNNPNRFTWDTDLKSFGRSSLSPKASVIEPKPGPFDKVKSRPPTAITVPEPVKPDIPAPTTLTLVIPSSVSKEEIMAFISLGNSLIRGNEKS